MKDQLELVNNLVADGHAEFTFRDAVERLGGSPTAAANMLRRLTENGLIDRVSRGHYAVRPLGSLNTSAASDDLGLAVGAAFGDRLHRIAYRSALSELGLLIHPVRTVTVAYPQQVRFSRLSGRPLRVVIEKPVTIHLGAERIEHSWRSGLERALLESAMRIDLAGGVDRLAEALASGSHDAKPELIHELAGAFGYRGLAAERRIASLSRALELPLALQPDPSASHRSVRLDPRDGHAAWVDTHFGVVWNVPLDELRAEIGN